MWQVAPDKSLSLDRPRLMGIVNATPDSFFDGSRVSNADEGLVLASRLVDEGCDILDIGAESTRPGAPRIDAEIQIERLVAVVRLIRAQRGRLGSIPISIDTTIARVAAEALDVGADAINDVSAGEDDPEMFALVGLRGAGLVVMHRVVVASEDSYSDCYEVPPISGDVVEVVRAFLAERCEAAIAAGVAHERIVVDPGLGFGKTVEQNMELIRRTGEIKELGFPVLSGLSRKSFVGSIVTGGRSSEPGDRLPGTLAMSLMHVEHGASLLRVHDVAAHASVLASGLAEGLGIGGINAGMGKVSVRMADRRARIGQITDAPAGGLTK